MTAPLLHLSRLARAAIAYAKQGWYVFPLKPRDKKPIIGNGFLAATNDLATVESWWTQHPQANIGLWPGQSGLVVIDLDGPEGEANAGALGLVDVPTLECATGRPDGGRHLYFERPDFSVSNANIAKKIDIRGDGGYVVLPPSIHPSGRQYEWRGRADMIRPLPEPVLEILRRAQFESVNASSAKHDSEPARDIAFESEIGEGGRNNTLTRYTGRLISKGVPDEEVLMLVSALNQTKCKPPLPQHEINMMVAGLSLREAKKRITGGGTTLSLLQPNAEPPAEAFALPTFEALAAEQLEKARALLARDITFAPRWAWPDLDALVGVMMPGDLVVVGAMMGNGKSALLMSQMDAFAAAKTPTLYIPLEIDPEVNQLRWAAWKLGLDVRHAIRQQWGLLPEGSREAIDGLLEELSANPYVKFPPPKRITVTSLMSWCRHAREQYDCRVVVLDHLHRMDFGSDAANHRVTVTDVVRRLKDMARELGIVLIAAAQLNRTNDPIDAYTAPGLARLKESAGIAEEADVVLMLSRRLRRDLPAKWANELRLGRLSERDLGEPGTMVVTCRKHRLDDEAFNRSALLEVVNGRVGNKSKVLNLYGSANRERWTPE